MTNTVKLWDGAAEVNPTAVSYFNAGESTISGFDYMPHGIEVRNMTSANAPFFGAHRGGSLDWAEMSMRAYTESVRAGADFLEFSVARTSDGVFFGLHDEDLNRTTPSLGATSYLASQHTWAEIKQLQIIKPSGGDNAFGAQPYVRLEEFLDAYAQSHTIFIDPKVIGGGQFTNLLNVMDKYPGGTNRFVGKYYCTGVSWGNACHARGYKTWGYYYSDDLATAGRLDSTVSAWDYLGIEYNDPQSEYDQLAATGKPIIAHIAPNLAAAQSAISKGAIGVMTSGLRSVLAGFQ